MNCPHCGATLSDDAKYCSLCFTRFEGAEGVAGGVTAPAFSEVEPTVSLQPQVSEESSTAKPRRLPLPIAVLIGMVVAALLTRGMGWIFVAPPVAALIGGGVIGVLAPERGRRYAALAALPVITLYAVLLILSLRGVADASGPMSGLYFTVLRSQAMSLVVFGTLSLLAAHFGAPLAQSLFKSK